MHEAAHGWAADKLGDSTARKLGRISINPFNHIDPVGTVLVPLMTLMTFGIAFGVLPFSFGFRPFSVGFALSVLPFHDSFRPFSVGVSHSVSWRFQLASDSFMLFSLVLCFGTV